MFRDAGQTRRCGQRQVDRAFVRRGKNLVTVSVHPTVIRTVSPVGLPIRAAKFGRHNALAPAFAVPGNPSRRQQAFVGRHVAGRGNAFLDCLLSLQRNGGLKDSIGLTIPLEVGAADGKMLQAQPSLELLATVKQKSVLCRFRLSSFEDCGHNHYGNLPVFKLRRSAWAGSGGGGLRLSHPTQRNSQLHQFCQARAIRDTSRHRLDLLERSWLSTHNLRRSLLL